MEKGHSIKDYLTKPIVTKINEQENSLRQKIMSEIIKTHKPYPSKGSSDEKIIKTLSERNILALDAEKSVTSIYPVSAIETNKKVIFEDGTYAYAMCAIDAIGFHYAFDKPIRIEGECEHCKKPIVLEIRDGKVEVIRGGEDVYILHADLENNEDWSCCCCNVMHFFACKENLEVWKQEHTANGKVFPVNLETGNKIAWLLFSN